MDCRTAVKKYIQRILDVSGLGMKALVMDKLTTHVLTQVYTMSQLAKSEVFLIEPLQLQNSQTLLARVFRKVGGSKNRVSDDVKVCILPQKSHWSL